VSYGANATAWRFESCPQIYTGNAAVGVRMGDGSGDGALVVFHDTPIKFSHVGARIRVACRFLWTGTSSAVDATGAIPTSLLELITGGDAPIARVSGVDLSALGSGKSLVKISATTNCGDIEFVNCKLGSSVSIIDSAIGQPGGPTVRVINCDSSDTQYRFAQYTYEGAEVSETTVVRSGGSTDGTTPVSRKIATTTGSSLHGPYRSLPIEFWNESLSALTVTIPILTDNVTLTDAEAWLEVEYLGTSGFPLGVFASDRVADPIFGTPANQTTDATSSWTTTGLGTPVKQSLSVTFTPAEKGIVRARVCIAKASTTVYYDPKALTTSARQYQSTAGYVNEGGPGAQPNIFDSAIIRAVHP